jgi:hypothetical protein
MTYERECAMTAVLCTYFFLLSLYHGRDQIRSDQIRSDTLLYLHYEPLL